ncbi:hypothetical protein [Novosphingobium sp. Gsoil 351]|nr:hypothetical protein [Novosphingobium sp. Gsoil 351]
MSQTKRGTAPFWVAPFLQSLRDGSAWTLHARAWDKFFDRLSPP